MSFAARFRARSEHLDLAIAVVLGTAYLALLLATAHEIGYARDEGFYFTAAEAYGAWFDLLLTDPPRALDEVDRYFAVNHEHPVLIKSLMAISYRVLHQDLGWVEHPGTSYRIPGMLLGALAVAVTYGWAARLLGRLSALVGAVSLGMMPRFFFHAHLACFDIPVASMWLVTTAGYFWAVERGGWGRVAIVGLLYGLLLNTKHNAWLLPPALLVHWVLTRWESFGRAMKTRSFTAVVPWPLIAMALVGPAVLWLTWPWLWHDTAERLSQWYEFHRHHVYYNMEFLGRTYFKPPMPRLYPWLMTAATVPAVTLALSLVGLILAGRGALLRCNWAQLRRQRQTSAYSAAAQPASTQSSTQQSAYLLWGLCIVTSYAPWVSSETPIFGGTKHWITAYPFVALFCALGFRSVFSGALATLQNHLRVTGARAQVMSASMAATVVAGPMVMALSAPQWGLSTYTPVVGGAPGAATLGLNRTFWGYTTGSVAAYLNRNVPPNQAVYVHDTALPSFKMMQRDGSLRGDLRASLSIAGSAAALYHHEPHMGRVEYQVWVNYGTTRPSYLGLCDGVPIVWVYLRPPGRPPDKQSPH